jgi:hypothetical protein
MIKYIRIAILIMLIINWILILRIMILSIFQIKFRKQIEQIERLSGDENGCHRERPDQKHDRKPEETT